METGVSSFSGRTLRHVRADLEDMLAHHCTYVVQCVTETDLLFYRRTMQEIFTATRDAGLDAWADPWGVAGVFGGESFSRFVVDHPETWQVLSDGRRVGYACPNHPSTRSFLLRWIDAAAECGAQALFWDEPHLYVGLFHGDPTEAWACRCEVCRALFRERVGGEMPDAFTEEVRRFREDTLLDLLAELCAAGHARGLRNVLCLLPTDLEGHGFTETAARHLRRLNRRRGSQGMPPLERLPAPFTHFGIHDWDAAAAISALDVFGVDPYWYLFNADPDAFMREFGGQAAAVARQHGRGLQIWVQGFSVPGGREEELSVGLRTAAELGATHVACWSYDGNRSMSYNRPDDPDRVWEVIGRTYEELRSRRRIEP